MTPGTRERASTRSKAPTDSVSHVSTSVPAAGTPRELVSVTIDPSAIDPEDADMLQDLIVAAVNDALRAYFAVLDTYTLQDLVDRPNALSRALGEGVALPMPRTAKRKSG